MNIKNDPEEMKSTNRFMIVDDDPTSNILCQYVIRRFFPATEIKLFTRPEAALETIKEEQGKTDFATVLLLDINMPSMSGWDFLDLFKEFSEEIHKRFTIYILSSSVDERDKAKAKTNPFVLGFLRKPLTFDSIRRIVSENNMIEQRSI